MDQVGPKFPIGSGVKQGDPLFSNLFNATLEGIFGRLQWQNYGIKINGEMINNLKFADDIVLIATKQEDIRVMVSDLKNESEKTGLKMNEEKTTVRMN